MIRPPVSVAHLTSAHPRDDVRILHKQCKSLVAAGYAVSLVVADDRGSEQRDGVRIFDVGTSRGRLGRMLRTTGAVLAQAIALDADVYHLHDPELLWAGLRLKKRGKVILFDSHEDVPLQLLSKPYLTPFALRNIARAYAALERVACARFDAVVAATPFIRDKFLLINPRSVDVCNYPVLGEFVPSREWAAKADEVCHVGTLSRIRGVGEIVTAMAQLGGGTRLNLVGEFSDLAFRESLAGQPGWERVIEHGVLDRSGVAEVYRRSRAGLVTLYPLANYRDALPIKMFEYMSAGIPVIASDFPLWADIIQRHRCGLCVPPLDPRAIAAAIARLLKDPQEAEEMGRNGRRAVLNSYNWRNEEAKLLALYEQIAPSRG